MDSAAGRALRGLSDLDPHLFPPWALYVHHWEGGKVKVDMAAYAPGAGPFKIAVSVEYLELPLRSQEKRKQDESSLDLGGLVSHPEEISSEVKAGVWGQVLVNEMDYFLLYFLRE